MTYSSETVELCHTQQAVKAKCFHPSGAFVEFKKKEIEQSIPDRFEQIVAKYPGRLAVKARNHALTYDELNRLSNRVARAILAQRGQGNEPIALLLEHDAPMIIPILGVLKAGKMCVPLDPLFPHSRTTYVLENSQADLMVTNNKNLSLAKELSTKAVLLLNIDEVDASLSTENLGLSISPDTIAYILYTSGSTGKPKGVVQNHRNVLHDIMQYTNTLHICPEDRMTLLYSYSVIGAVRGIFAALLNGAALYPLDIRKEGLATLVNLLMQEEITFYHSVPTVFRNFVATLTENEKFPRLRLIRFGGERVLTRDVELYKRHFPDDCLLYTGMGATETGYIRQYFIDKQTQVTGTVVPAGYPVEDKEVVLLDHAGEEVGFNHVGEIAVKSRYLSPGYWQKPDHTTTAFLLTGGGERIYRTGDVGRMRPDGRLEHIGRKDFQVKVRGHRIEVAEIEAALLALGTIRDTVVVGLEDRSGEKRLVAYIVSTDKPGPTINALRRALSEKLPDYMIPSNFVFLDALPLTPNGKIDRRALPDPGQSRPELDTPFVAHTTPVETKLATIWAEVLCLDQVGIHDDFLELGGHSLAATRVISRVMERFNIELPITSLFEAPTVAEMAEVVVRYQKQRAEHT